MPSRRLPFTLTVMFAIYGWKTAKIRSAILHKPRINSVFTWLFAPTWVKNKGQSNLHKPKFGSAETSGARLH